MVFLFIFSPRNTYEEKKKNEKKKKKKTIKAMLATCHQHALPWKRDSAWIVVVVVIQSAFHLEMHQNNIFYFLKKYF
jgi:hypothetical protein